MAITDNSSVQDNLASSSSRIGVAYHELDDYARVVASMTEDGPSLNGLPSYREPILGFAILCPYTWSTPEPGSCCHRTASFHIIAREDTIGKNPLLAGSGAIADEALLRARARGGRYETVITSFLYRQDMPKLMEQRKMFIQNGFEQARRLKEVAEKRGLFFDRLILQRTFGKFRSGD